MTLIDVPLLLQPLDHASPCGPDLEYSPAYLEAARALEGTPEVQYGSMRVAATEPDWKHVKAATLELLRESRDLRLAVWLTRALVALHGAAAIAQGLALIEGLLARYWDTLHPQLDADDDLDPAARINTLLSLDDKTAFVRSMRLAPLIVSPRLGAVSLDDIERAGGDSDADVPALEPAAIDAAFADVSIDEVSAVHAALASAVTSLERIDAQLNERVGHCASVTLAALDEVLAHALRAMAAQLARHPARLALAGEPAAPSPDVTGPAASDRIADRDDVVRTLERLCAYYAQAEPSSPVPILLQRARALVGMRFADLVADLTPAAMDQVKHWAGEAQPQSHSPS
ncbi:type VI secretion system protein TssA [Trinickia dabaoshanensis]|uniref:Type VI secretion system protein TssA n=1 Tax=Trinickia dabaoshanensis TaxID=564714 RepID=A0A2N7VTH0_9BURK|nr:type VI secretion system protein TssA [Trinickia dabaoshanensis]PMS20442.1 type VI secretion system protein TssA [Trinickia dabaoshanensis]